MDAGLLNLTFHGIGEPPQSIPEGERRVWLDQTGFERALDAVADDPHARISFDDGNRSDVDIALPALRERGLRATFFVVAERIGRPGYLDAADLSLLRSEGMRVGCHGMRHRSWRGLADPELTEELEQARELIEDAAASPVREAACPFGTYDRRLLGAARRAGYERLFTSDGGRAAPGAWLQPRNTIGSEGDPAAAIAALRRRPPRHARAIRAAKLRVKALR